MQQRFGWDATDVQSRPAQLRILLDERCFEPVLTGANRRGVTARPAADNDQIISHFDFRIAFEFLISLIERWIERQSIGCCTSVIRFDSIPTSGIPHWPLLRRSADRAACCAAGCKSAIG